MVPPLVRLIFEVDEAIFSTIYRYDEPGSIQAPGFCRILLDLIDFSISLHTRWNSTAASPDAHFCFSDDANPKPQTLNPKPYMMQPRRAA
jgi:hypothetical protein